MSDEVRVDVRVLWAVEAVAWRETVCSRGGESGVRFGYVLDDVVVALPMCARD